MKKNILVIGPHVDDGEWGCGASIAKWLEEGNTVFYVSFSAAEESVIDGFPLGILRKEILDSANELGLNELNVLVLNFTVRFFPRDRQEILEEMINLKRKIKPNIVVVPSSYDTHQDHEVISQEAFRAFKESTILGYEFPTNNKKIDLTFFNVVSQSHLDKKIAAMGAYKSQLFRAQNYADLIESLATIRGWQIRERYAEAFEVIRWVEH